MQKKNIFKSFMFEILNNISSESPFWKPLTSSSVDQWMKRQTNQQIN